MKPFCAFCILGNLNNLNNEMCVFLNFFALASDPLG